DILATTEEGPCHEAVGDRAAEGRARPREHRPKNGSGPFRSNPRSRLRSRRNSSGILPACRGSVTSGRVGQTEKGARRRPFLVPYELTLDNSCEESGGSRAPMMR